MRAASILPLFAAILLAGLAARGPDVQAEQDAPKVAVIDGDTLQVGKTIVHLNGIDAPELGQRCKIEKKEWRCGLDAALALRKLIAFGQVACEIEGEQAILSTTCAAASRDLSEALLSQGYALTLPEPIPSYANAEAAAREAKLGLWRGDFVRPDDWRQGKRLPGEVTDTTFCVVKGTIGEDGQKLFHIPSDEDYEEIAIDPGRGERMFCSDDEAILAGWARFPRVIQ